MTLKCGRYGWLGLATLVAIAGCRARVETTIAEARDGKPAEHFERAAKHLVALDVGRARAELDRITERRFEVELVRARLALAVGDCQGAVTLLSSYSRDPATASEAHTTQTGAAMLGVAPRAMSVATELHSVANGCARAMAGATILVDEQRGVWVRFQNDHDKVLLPLIADAADRAATEIGKHLGTTLPRPLRIELVADLASLATVTGLPLDAAETTGTIAIARWGKVTLVSPRATPDGYPWQDTLAHELAHLVVARRSADSAPLWLQEGIAKREETRWRSSMPLDGADNPHREARQALLEGRSIGVDRLGASIAMLPTPQAAETAYAEVRDFLDYWIDNNGEPALVLLLHDLAGIGSDGVDQAMISVSGYSLNQWIRRWQHSLVEEGQRAAAASERAANSEKSEVGWSSDWARRMRLGELLLERQHVAAAAEQLEPLKALTVMPPELAEQLARTQLLLGQPEVARRFIDPGTVRHLDGPWLAMRGRVLARLGEPQAAEQAFQQALAFAPTLEKVACRGMSVGEAASSSVPSSPPDAELWLTLCRAAEDLQRQ